jgi:hypothetical protein
MIRIGRTTTIAAVIGSGLLVGACAAPADEDETSRAGQQLVIDPLVFDTTAAREDPWKVEVEVEVDVEAPKKKRRGKPKNDEDKGKETETKDRDAKDAKDAKDDERKTNKDEEKGEEETATQATPIIVDAQCCVNGVCRWGPCDPYTLVYPYGGEYYGGYPYGGYPYGGEYYGGYPYGGYPYGGEYYGGYPYGGGYYEPYYGY